MKEIILETVTFPCVQCVKLVHDPNAVQLDWWKHDGPFRHPAIAAFETMTRPGWEDEESDVTPEQR